MIKILPITNCKDCPKFTDEDEFKGCELSDVRCYELDSNWEDYLEQFCPLQFLETIIEDSYEMGLNYKEYKNSIIKDVRKSVQSDKWVTAHDFLEKINEKGE